MQNVWYVLEDGRVADPNECSPDDAGALIHSSGVPVAMRSPGVPLSRGVDVGKDMRPGFDYLTRQPGAFDHDGDDNPGGSRKPPDPEGDLSALRAEYQEKVGKRPFAGWDADMLRQKIAAAGKAD